MRSLRAITRSTEDSSWVANASSARALSARALAMVGTDFGSLAAELRPEGTAVPPAYADLAEVNADADDNDDDDRPASHDADGDDEDDRYTQLRKSG